jgi:thiamine-phosphate pyrophosphorylase
MPKRHTRPLPKVWLMTDERLGAQLMPSIAALPAGSGIIFRHYALPTRERRFLFEAVKRIAKRRRLTLILAGDAQTAAAWGADGAHGRTPKRHPALQTAPVHSIAEAVAAQQSGADLLFMSPLFATRSHSGGRTLGVVRFGLMRRAAKVPVIALGGMSRTRAQRLKLMNIHGWAAIDGLTR